MKPLLLSLLFSCNLFFSFGQNFKIGHREITWIDSSRSNRAVKFEVYYPVENAADNSPVVNNGRKFPLIVFGHGFQLTYKDYLWLKDSLVPNGFFMVFPRTEEKLFPSHTDFAKDFAFIVDRFDATKSNPGAWYYSRIKAQYVAGGHSMGGGCSLLSVQYSSKINYVFNFAAAETNPSAISACKNIKIPALIFAGGKDCVAPPSSNQLPMYNNIQNTCKTYIQITNTLHCQWSNNNSTCRLGEFFCSPSTSSPASTFAITFSFLKPWLNEFTNSGEVAKQRFQQLLTTTDGITYQQNCTVNKNFNNSPEGEINSDIKAYPSIGQIGVLVNVFVPKLNQQSVLQIISQSGKIIFTKKINPGNEQSVQLNTEKFEKGIYFIVITDSERNYKSNILIQ